MNTCEPTWIPRIHSWWKDFSDSQHLRKPYLDVLRIFLTWGVFLCHVTRAYSSQMQRATDWHDRAWEHLRDSLRDQGVFRLRQAYYNDNLADLVLNKGEGNKIIVGEGRLIRKKDPVFMDPARSDGSAHFYAPSKRIGSWTIDTFWFNFAVIWLMSLILYVTLLHDTLRKLIGFAGKIRKGKSS